MFSQISLSRSFAVFVAALFITSTIAAPLSQVYAADNLIQNPGFESGDTGWSLGYGTSNQTFQVTADATAPEGSSVAVVTVSDLPAGEDAKLIFAPVAVTPGATYTFSNWYKSDVVSTYGAFDGDGNYIDMFIADGAIASDWTQTTATIIVPPTVTALSIGQAIAANGTISTDDYSLTLDSGTPPPADNMFGEGFVTLSFDDGWKSVYTNAFPILGNTFPSTQFIYTEAILGGYSDNMSKAELQEMRAAGHEIGSHTVSHMNLITEATSSEAVSYQLHQSRQDIIGLGLGTPVSFAYPYGACSTGGFGAPCDADLVQALKDTPYYGARTVDSDALNFKDTDPYELKIKHVAHDTTAADIQAWIDEAKAQKGWLILMFHEVLKEGETCVGAEGGNDYTECSTEEVLQAAVDYLGAQSIPVKTMRQGLEMMGVSIPSGDEELVPSLGLTRNTASPDSSTIKVDNATTTNDVTVTVFDLSASTAPYHVTSVPVRFALEGATYNDVVSKVELEIGGVAYDATSVSGGDTTTAVANFDLGESGVAIPVDTPTTAKVIVDFKPRTGNYENGEKISAGITESERDAIMSTETLQTRSGTALGSTHQLWTEGVFAEVVSTDATLDTSSGHDVGTYTIKTDVTAFAGTFYMSATSSNAFPYHFEDETGATVIPVGTSTVTLTSTASTEVDAYRIDDGLTETFTLVVTLDPVEAGTYHVILDSIEYGSAAGTPFGLTHNASPVGDFTTNALTYTGGTTSPEDTTAPSVLFTDVDNLVFSPNGDDSADTVTVAYLLSEWANLTAEVLSVDNTVVSSTTTTTEIVDDMNVAAFTWDGADDSYVLQQNGTYTFRLTMTDAAGNRASDTSVNVTLENPDTSTPTDCPEGQHANDGTCVDDEATTTPPTARGGGGGGGSIIRSRGNKADTTATTTATTSATTTEATSDTATTTTATSTGRILGADTFRFNTDLWLGMSGNDVTELQKRLQAEGFYTFPTVTGYFGPITKAAVEAYQRAHNIVPASGYVGPMTRAALNKTTSTLPSDDGSEVSLEALVRLLLSLGLIPADKADKAMEAIAKL